MTGLSTTNTVVALLFGVAAVLLTVWWTSLRARRRLRRLARQQVGLIPRDSTPQRDTSFARVARAHASRPFSARRRRKRAEAMDDQLSPALQLIVGHLRVGRNIVAALSEVAAVTPEPLGSVLGEIVAEARLGTPVDEVLQSMAALEHNRHLNIVASAIGLHTRHGGSLIEILETVVDTIEEEDRLRRDIRSLTADGRLSAKVLLAMPPAMLGFVTLTSPGYAEPLIDTALGRVMSIIGAVLAAGGWYWLRVISAPEVVG